MKTWALTKESEARLETWARHLTPDYLDFLRETLVIAESAAVARHVRETGCDGLREALRRHIVALGELCELVTRHEDATECGCGDFDDWFQSWDGPAQRLHVPDDVMAEAVAALASPATEEVLR